MQNNGWKRWLCAVTAVLLIGRYTMPMPTAAEKADISDHIGWPGEQDVWQPDGLTIGVSNASGLDFQNGNLYAVDNGTGSLWILEVLREGTVRPAAGFEEGKRIKFADTESTGIPDAEGITVSDDGSVYVASERDNQKYWVSSNMVLQLDPWTDENALHAVQVWDLTKILPASAANSGIEAVEWVNGSDMTGRLPDQTKQKIFDMLDYPQGVSGGIFFLTLEMNEHLYACVLNQNGTVSLIADFELGLTGISALDYDSATGVLWAASDDRGENRLVKLRFSEERMEKEFVLPPESLDITYNNEGFAIAEESYTKNDRRPVYWLQDGVFSSALTIGSLAHHIHMFTEEWQKDDQGHWQTCACGVRQNEEKHHFGNNIIAAAQKRPASRTHTAIYYLSCLICGAIDTEHTFAAGQLLNPERFATPVAKQIFGIPQM